jgi:phosphoribosyl 1,2-cyclic phosphate phosphodiesterase
VRVLFLGTGTSHGVPMIGCDCAVCRSADPRDSRLRPSIVVRGDDGLQVLVDTTPDLRQQALRHDLRQVDAICLTHAHADHIMGLDEVRRFNVLSGARIPVYGQTTTLDAVRGIFSYAFDRDSQKGGGVPRLALWPVGGRFVVGTTEITPVPVMHGTWRILGLRFGRLAYLTDCNHVPDESLALLGDALRRRAHPTHFSLDQAVAVARTIGARRTYFTHIAHDLAHAATCAALPEGMALAHDGLTFDID